MYGTVLGVLIALTGVIVWNVIKKYTRLSPAARMVLTALLTVLAAFPLLFLTVHVSVLLYQLNDPINW